MRDERPVWSARRQVWLGWLTVATLTFGFGGWAVMSEISGAIVAPGQVEVEQRRQVVQHPDGGVVAEILVSEAQSVRAGDLLIRLDGSLLHSELAIVEGQLFETLARRARLEAERDDAASLTVPAELRSLAGERPEVANLVEGQISLFQARRDTLDRQVEQLAKRLDQFSSQIEGIDAQSTALQTQLRLIEEELADQKALLERGLAQASRVLALEREQARLMGEVGSLLASRAQTEGRVTEIELEVLRLEALRREEANEQLREIGPQELELAERRRALSERVARLDIRAPVSGIVLGLQVTTPRSVLRPADPVLYLVPQDRPLVIAAKISPIHVDEVRVGGEVKLMFPAFSNRATPELVGRVAALSADALTDPATQAPYYRAEISLDAGEADRLGDATLLPGMPVEAFIQTQPRTPMAYMLKPFTDYFNRAFRES